MAPCVGCGATLPPRRVARPRKWCSDRCRKLTLYARPCLDCGKRINTDGSVTNAAERCINCNAAHQRRTSRTWIIESINEWVDLFGVPPTASDWEPRMPTAPAWRRERYEATGRPWPSVHVAQDNFGSWSNALRAAGWDPYPVGHYGRDGEDPEVIQHTAERYLAGMSGPEIARADGVTAGCVDYRLEKAGVQRRSHAEARAAHQRRAA